jgi:hypothetical protein
VILLPLGLSNRPGGFVVGILCFAFLFFFPGYLLLTVAGGLEDDLQVLLSLIVGMTGVTTAFSLFARAAAVPYFFGSLAALCIAGMALAAWEMRKRSMQCAPLLISWGPAAAGVAVVLGIAPLYWRSGRFWGDEFVLQGPAGNDPLFHLTLLQRLLHHVPPDNFMVSGLRAPVYHYFTDLALSLVPRAQTELGFAAIDLFDLYYRCYPLLLYFLLGALTYRTGRRLVGSVRGGILGVLLLLGGGGLGWFLGFLQTVSHLSPLAEMQGRLLSTWTTWDGVDGIFPLVHRPAHYQGLLISLAAFNILLRRERSRRDWILAGLLLGLMAGFNFTLAAIFGLAAVLGGAVLFLRRRSQEARDLAWLAGFIFLGSLPVTSAMLASGFHNPAPGFPFRGPNLEFSTTMWGGLLGRLLPGVLVPLASLIVFPILAYGIKLFGLRAMARFDLGEERYRGIATVFAWVFGLSCLIGIFFPYDALGGQAIIFLQPTLWIIGLFSVRPIDNWMAQHSKSWRQIAVWAMLTLTWTQATLAFHFGYQVALSRGEMQVLEDIRRASAPDDVIAYLPTSIEPRPVLGFAPESTNFVVTGLTGLDGYFSARDYSVPFAVPGLSGRNAEGVLQQAERLYEQREADVNAFVKGTIDDQARARLQRDHVQWIVITGKALREISTVEKPWESTPEITAYRISL